MAGVNGWCGGAILRCRLCLAPVRHATAREQLYPAVREAALAVLPDECLFCAPKRRAACAAEQEQRSAAE